jgi:hypothetical protein
MNYVILILILACKLVIIAEDTTRTSSMLKWQTIAQKSARQLAGQTHRSFAKLSNNYGHKNGRHNLHKKNYFIQVVIKITTLVHKTGQRWSDGWVYSPSGWKSHLKFSLQAAGKPDPQRHPNWPKATGYYQIGPKQTAMSPGTTTFHTSHQPNEAAWTWSSQANSYKNSWSQNMVPAIQHSTPPRL